MSFIITSVRGKLHYNDNAIDNIPHCLPTPLGINDGCLSIDASINNILIISEYLLHRFVRPGGVFLASDKKWGGYTGLNVTRRYLIDRSPDNITRGWCYLLSGAMHRFFYKEWDIYRTKCKLDDTDFHCWLQDKEGNVIDLTQEQYIVNNVYNCREGGKKIKPCGLSWGVKTRNIAFITAKELTNSKSLYSPSSFCYNYYRT